MQTRNLFKDLRRFTKPYRHSIMQSAVQFCLRVLGAVPMRVNSRIGAWLGWLASYCTPRYFQQSLEHLEIAFGDEMTPEERVKLARRSYQNLGMSFMEVVSFRQLTTSTLPEFIEVSGTEAYADCIHRGQGAVLIGQHLGNWEFKGAVLPLLGLPFSVVVRETPDPGLSEQIQRIREFWGEKIYVRSPIGSAKAALKVLRGGEGMGALIDQDTKVDSVFVPFFGRLASTPCGPAALALKTDAPIFLLFIERLGPAKHRFWMEGPFPKPAGEIRCQEAMKDLTAALSKRIEEEVRRRPAEWVWMHRRWKTRPDHEDGQG